MEISTYKAVAKPFLFSYFYQATGKYMEISM